MTESKRPNYFLPLIIAVTLTIGLLVGHVLTPQFSGSTQSNSGYNKLSKLQDIITILNNRYVDTINGQALFEQSISEMLHKLDPHSNYIPAKDLARVNESIEGHFGGVGIRFFIIRDTVCVTNVIPGSPSEQGGVKSGDKILMANGTALTGKKVTNEKVMSLLKGKPATLVNLKLLRKKAILSKRIVRGIIEIQSIECAYMIKPGVGYVRIAEFSMTTSQEFTKAARLLLQQGMKKVIIDLRDNGGGVLTGATEIADHFLKAGQLMLTTKGTHTGKQEYVSTAGGLLENTPVSILINTNSASASEILAGAIQDNDRGTIIGRRSFGKGLVQEDIRLQDGSDLRVTIARYYTPSGRCIQKPYTSDYDAYMDDQLSRLEKGELYTPDSSVFKNAKKFKTKKGRTVYEGGGIMPDIFVPFDSLGNTMYFTDLRYSPAFQAFAFDMVHNGQQTWKSLPVYVKSFVVTDQLLQRFTSFAQKEYGVKVNKAEFLRSKKLIAETLKKEIARQIWVEVGYFTVNNLNDRDVQTALTKF